MTEQEMLELNKAHQDTAAGKVLEKKRAALPKRIRRKIKEEYEEIARRKLGDETFDESFAWA